MVFYWFTPLEAERYNPWNVERERAAGRKASCRKRVKETWLFQNPNVNKKWKKSYSLGFHVRQNHAAKTAKNVVWVFSHEPEFLARNQKKRRNSLIPNPFTVTYRTNFRHFWGMRIWIAACRSHTKAPCASCLPMRKIKLRSCTPKSKATVVLDANKDWELKLKIYWNEPCSSAGFPSKHETAHI